MCLLLLRFSSCTAVTHAATKIVGCVGANFTLTGCHFEAADSDDTWLRQRTLLPSREIPRISLFTPIFTTHHARSKQRKQIQLINIVLVISRAVELTR